MGRIVFFDPETDSVKTGSAQIVQIAAVAVDADYREVSSFSRLLRFDESKADPKALEINHYDRERWAREAVPVAAGLAEFCAWAKPTLDVQKISKAGNPYYVGTLCGYNAAAFDAPILQRVCKDQGIFLPFDFRVRDAFLVAVSICDFLGVTLKDYKLGTVAEHFGAPVAKAHDALSDVRTTVALMRTFRDMFTAKAAA